MATGGSSSSNVVPAGAGAGEPRLVHVSTAECLRKNCKTLRVLVHVNDYRKAVVLLHGTEDGQPDHVIVFNVSPDDDALQLTYGVNMAAESTDEDAVQMVNDWYSSFRLDKTGVFYDSEQNVIFGVPRGHPGVDMPRHLTILPAAKKNQPENTQAASSSSAGGIVASHPSPASALLLPNKIASTDKRRRFNFPDQRKRIKAMKKSDLEYYLHKTQKEAAEIGLSIGTTALKSICRANSLPRWPYRKILKVDNEFDNDLKKKITGKNLAKTVQGVTKAFEIRTKKEALYQEIMADIPEELQGIDKIVHELQEAYNAGLDLETDDEDMEE